MGTGKLDAEPEGSRVHEIAIAGESISNSGSQRARLMGASALTGGAVRGFAIAAGMVTAFGATPALADCASDTPSFTGSCTAAAAIGVNSTAVGAGARADGIIATTFGAFANATGLNATAIGGASVANGDRATATGAGATANGADATAKLKADAGGSSLTGLVTGLTTGSNTLAATGTNKASAKLTVVNHPITGPLFAGPQEQPFVCITDKFKLVGGGTLGPALDANCSIATRVDFVYRSTDGKFKPLADPKATPADAEMIDRPGTRIPNPESRL